MLAVPSCPANTRLLLLALAYLANPAGSVTVTDGSLAAMTGMHVKSVRWARWTCERHGAIEVQPLFGQRQGAREGLTYRLLIPRTADAAVDPHADSTMGKPSKRV